MQRSNTSSAPLIKICGITRVGDGLAALRAGADWIGLIRWVGSPRRYRPAEEAAAMLRELRAEAPRPFQAVGVYVDETPEAIAKDAARVGLDRVQLHGAAPDAERAAAVVLALFSRLGRPIPIIQVLKIRDATSLAAAESIDPSMEILADTDDPALPGGTGRGYDYALLRGLIGRRRVLIAGGLTPENVGEVVAGLRPYGVDVSSGVESSPGLKDHDRVRAFIGAVRGAMRPGK